jgi:[ribosomal protein S5]-alanine N-acetyltransferase
VTSELPTLRGDSVLVRAFTHVDIGVLQEVAEDPIISKITTVPAIYDEATAIAYIERQHDRLRSGEGYSFAICRSDHEHAVGQIGIWLTDLAKGRATVGYWIAGSARGAGLAGRALSLVSGWAFEMLPVHRLTAYVEPWNVGSIRTAESAGYAVEGLLRHWELVDGEPKDMLSMYRFRGPQSRSEVT